MVFLLATWRQKAFKFAARLRRIVFVFLGFLNPGSKCHNYLLGAHVDNTGCCPAEHLFSPLLFLFRLYHLTPSTMAPPLLQPFVRDDSHYPQEGFLRINSKLLFLVYKSLQDLALSSHQTNLSIPWHIKLVSSTWNALLSDLCTSDSFSSFIPHFKFCSSGLPCSSNIKQLFDHFSLSPHLIITTLVMVWFVWHIVCA